MCIKKLEKIDAYQFPSNVSAWLCYFFSIHKHLFIHSSWWSRLFHWVDSLCICYGWWLGISVRNYFIASDQPDSPHAPQTTEDCWEFSLHYCKEFGYSCENMAYNSHSFSITLPCCSSVVLLLQSSLARLPSVQYTVLCSHPYLLSCPSSSSACLQPFLKHWTIFSTIWRCCLNIFQY